MGKRKCERIRFSSPCTLCNLSHFKTSNCQAIGHPLAESMIVVCRYRLCRMSISCIKNRHDNGASRRRRTQNETCNRFVEHDTSRLKFTESAVAARFFRLRSEDAKDGCGLRTCARLLSQNPHAHRYHPWTGHMQRMESRVLDRNGGEKFTFGILEE